MACGVQVCQELGKEKEKNQRVPRQRFRQCGDPAAQQARIGGWPSRAISKGAMTELGDNPFQIYTYGNSVGWGTLVEWTQ